ncbi:MULTISPECIES: hypothetical protein [Paenibacillus]|jgi:hypothetical protein|uniref:Uncharacterized protein n=1 Tax=Paenibacillus odorifer TaxID=189426 RepID=A0ABX3GEE5_9BACL|nr:hypothetical protein [Paenibacillus odorifer]OMC74607.1 hypothetical protein BK121_00775 [Paenibacillus odorifer]OMC80478.1 hypothetical protein BK125_01315 [Paenibacillus odorifer]OMD06258.1 hypothetical protein BSO21_31025 [Paenibacillus odorifer]OMD96462.1 hypothetical protein BSK67_04905 [Paenibacillus odorifer]
MAISVMILDPQNDFEKHFFLPVATESFFKECWIPAIQSLGLRWVDLFSTGVDVEEEDLPSILAELDQLKEWADQNLEEEQKTKLFERVEGIKEKLPNAFQRKDAVVFIG